MKLFNQTTKRTLAKILFWGGISLIGVYDIISIISGANIVTSKIQNILISFGIVFIIIGHLLD